MSPDEKARPRREARDGQEVESHRHLATNTHSRQALSVADHQAARHALRAACIAVGLFAGSRPEELAGEVARRAVACLRSKGAPAMSRRRRKRSKAPEPDILIQRPPVLRSKWETSRVLDLLDSLQAGNVNKEGTSR